MGATGVLLSGQAEQIIGFVVLFVVVYAILYKPVIRMLEKGPSRIGGGAEPPPPVDSDRNAATAGEPPVVRIPWYRDRLLLSIIITAFLVDQVSKQLVRATLRLHESWPAEGLIRLTHGTNTGTAFGLFPDQTLILIVASFFAIGFLYYFYRSHAFPSRLLRVAMGLQLGGALGNLVDRIIAGAVVDFIDLGWWPVFNLADSSIVIGIAMLVAVLFFGKDFQSQHQGSSGHVRLDE